MNNQQALFALIRQAAGQANVLTIPRVFITLSGSIPSALFLSQVIYWSDRSGRADGWFYKTTRDWQEEIALSRREVEAARAALKGIIETKVMKANGVPTLHYRVNIPALTASLLELLGESDPAPEPAPPPAPSAPEPAPPQNSGLYDSSKPVCTDRANPFVPSEQTHLYDSGKSLTEINPETTPEREKILSENLLPPAAPVGAAPPEKKKPKTDPALSLDATPGGRVLHALLEREYAAKYGLPAPARFASLALRDKWLKVEAALGDSVKAAVTCALEAGVLSLPKLVGYCATIAKNEKPPAPPDHTRAAAAARSAVYAASIPAPAAPAPSTPPPCSAEEAEAWRSVRLQLAANLNAPTFETYVRPLVPLGWEEGEKGEALFRLAAPDSPTADWVRSRLKKQMDGLLSSVHGSPAVFTLTAKPEG